MRQMFVSPATAHLAHPDDHNNLCTKKQKEPGKKMCGSDKHAGLAAVRLALQNTGERAFASFSYFLSVFEQRTDGRQQLLKENFHSKQEVLLHIGGVLSNLTLFPPRAFVCAHVGIPLFYSICLG